MKSHFISATFTVTASTTTELAQRIEEGLRKHPLHAGEGQRFRITINSLGSKDPEPETPCYDDD